MDRYGSPAISVSDPEACWSLSRPPCLLSVLHRQHAWPQIILLPKCSTVKIRHDYFVLQLASRH